MYCSTLPVDDTVSGQWLQPPLWVRRLMGQTTRSELRPSGSGLSGHLDRGGNWCCISVRVADATDLPPLDLQRATVHAYRAIRECLAAGPNHPVRIWNFIPSINQFVDERTDRYMVFNAGRYAAYMEWYGCDDLLGDIATASGVGHTGSDLFVHCLAGSHPGIAVENPRQVPAWRYSQRYGPFPPSFTRATIVPGLAGHVDQLFVGGTASICGEHSLHLSNLQRQTRETLRNLAAVVKAALARRDGSDVDVHVNGDMNDWLLMLSDVRVYYVHPEHRTYLKKMLAIPLGRAGEIEWVRADLCRPELLVEIEGVADLPPQKPQLGQVGRSGA